MFNTKHKLGVTLIFLLLAPFCGATGDKIGLTKASNSTKLPNAKEAVAKPPLPLPQTQTPDSGVLNGNEISTTRLEEIPNLEESQIRIFIEDIATEISLLKGNRQIKGSDHLRQFPTQSDARHATNCTGLGAYF